MIFAPAIILIMFMLKTKTLLFSIYLRALINEELYFADYTKLNDPFECYFMKQSWIDESLEEYKKINLDFMKS